MMKSGKNLLLLCGLLLGVAPCSFGAAETDLSVRLGNEAMRVRHYAAAAGYYTEALTGVQLSERPGVMLKLIEAELCCRNTARARQLMEEWQRTYRGRSAGLLPGRILAAEGKLQEAADWFDEAARRAESPVLKAEARLEQAALLLDAGKAPAAVTLLETVEYEAEKRHDLPHLWKSRLRFLHVIALLRADRTEEAEKLLDGSPYRQEFPLDHAKAALQIALQKKDFSKFRDLWAKLPPVSVRENELARLAMQGARLVTEKSSAEEIAAALRLMEEAVTRADPGNSVREILRQKINCEEKLDPDRAVRTITRNLAEFDSPSERYELGITAAKLLTRSGRHREALAWYRKLQNGAFTPEQQWNAACEGAREARQLNLVSEEEQQLNYALHQAEQIAGTDGRKIGVSKFLLGDFYRHAGRLADAEKVLLEACEIPGPHVEEARLLLLQTLSGEKKYQEALPHAEKLLKSADPARRQRAAYLRAFVLDRLGRYPDALIACQSLLNDAPNAADAPAALFLMAEVEMALQHFSEAAKAYRQFAENCKDHPDAQLALRGAARACFLLNDETALQEVMKTFQGRHPQSPTLTELHLQLACDYTAAGQYARAEDELQAVSTVKEERYKAEYLFRRAELLRRRRRPREAGRLFHDVRNDFPLSPFSADACFQEGDMLYDQTLFEEAVKAFEEAKKRESDPVFKLLCRGRIADCMRQMGDHANAQKEFEKLSKEKGAPDAVQMRSLVRLALCARERGDWKTFRDSCEKVLLLAGAMRQDGIMPERAEVRRALELLLKYEKEKNSEIGCYLDQYEALKLDSAEEIRMLRKEWQGEETSNNRNLVK